MNQEQMQALYDDHRKNYLRQVVWVLVILGLLVWSASTIDQVALSKNGWTYAKSIMQGIFTPDPDLLFSFSKQSVPYLILETMAVAFLGTLVGAVISLPLAFLASSRIMPGPVVFVTRALIMLIRTIPGFVYGLMFIRVTGPGPFAGLMTLSVTSIGMITKLFSETIDDIDLSILEAMEALGANTFEKIRCGILPQLSSSLISTVIFRFDMNLRDASILGLVGAGGIGAPLIFAMSSHRWNQVGAILLGLILLILVVEYASSAIRTRIAHG